MHREDWLLLVLNSAKGHELTPIQLQKSLFLLGQMVPQVSEGDFYNFYPYSYGPFDPTIYFDAEKLEEKGLIGINLGTNRWREYFITSEGSKYSRKLKKQIDEDIIEYIEKIVSLVRSLPFRKLVKLIYRHFPEYKANSIFQE